MSSATLGSMDRLREAVLAKAREEAERIVREAEERARRIVEEARERKRREIEEARRRLYEEVGYEARIAEARIRAAQLIARVKNEVLEELRAKVMDRLSRLSEGERRRSVEKLLWEALGSGVVGDRFRLYVAKRDSAIAEDVVTATGLRDRVAAVVGREDMVGGVIIESEDGSTRVDNSYSTRLSMVLRRRAGEISRALFGG
ncbi:MAG: hypothetical protein GXO32_08450 [Crenarchaeota archaeon]|nr:hypothetical protein [Thermoproteota archaeon]